MNGRVTTSFRFRTVLKVAILALIAGALTAGFATPAAATPITSTISGAITLGRAHAAPMAWALLFPPIATATVSQRR